MWLVEFERNVVINARVCFEFEKDQGVEGDGSTRNRLRSPFQQNCCYLNIPFPTFDVTDGASVGDVTCTFTTIISSTAATVSLLILPLGCVSTQDPTAFRNTVATADTTQV